MKSCPGVASRCWFQKIFLDTMMLVSLYSYVIRVIYLHTAWCWFLLENLRICQLIKKSPTLYGILIFINAFTRSHRRFHSCATKIHSLSPFPLSEDPFQYHSLIYVRVFQWLFTSCFPTNKIYEILPSPIRAL